MARNLRLRTKAVEYLGTDVCASTLALGTLKRYVPSHCAPGFGILAFIGTEDCGSAFAAALAVTSECTVYAVSGEGMDPIRTRRVLEQCCGTVNWHQAVAFGLQSLRPVERCLAEMFAHDLPIPPRLAVVDPSIQIQGDQQCVYQLRAMLSEPVRFILPAHGPDGGLGELGERVVCIEVLGSVSSGMYFHPSKWAKSTAEDRVYGYADLLFHLL